ncbi:hypothetical protein ABZ366_31290, partial [Streptomyces sp. NPDC005904]
MEAAPVFEEFDPESDCGCPGCLHWRRAMVHALPVRLGGHPAALGQENILGGADPRDPDTLVGIDYVGDDDEWD